MFLVDQIDLTGDQGVLVYDEDGNEFWFTLEEVEVMQFTGLHDKNGKEVFEGDIVNSKESTIPVKIEWREEYAEFSLFDKDGFGFGQFIRQVKYWIIIGNIYENKEILK